MTTETRKRRNYTEDFKRDAVALVAEPRAQAIVIKADARKQARIIRKTADAEALRLVKAALTNYLHMLTYRYIDQLSPERAVMIIKVSDWATTGLTLPVAAAIIVAEAIE